MKLLEASAFLTLAGALHVAAFTLSPPGLSGGDSGGAGGTDALTLAALPPAMAQMVQDWTRAPELADTLPEPAAPIADAAAPAPRADPLPPRAHPLAAPRLDTATDKAPAIRTNPRLAPPVLPAQVTAQVAAPVNPTQPTAATRPRSTPDRPLQRPRQALMKPPATAALPRVDPTPAEPRHAPGASLRPHPRPDRTPAAQSRPTATDDAPRAAQRATGNGGTTGGSTARPAAPSGPSRAALQNAQAQWGAQIRQRVARAQRYPRGTRATGVVKLQITVTRAGTLAGARILTSSGDAALDRAALSAARSARLPAAPAALPDNRYSFNLPLRFARR
ncbi:TonB family protein [Mesobacterium sp. TK19101]|uniref:TonB family protein n=1 Tax=Mesobacterium hydrothermale TaxID=3111907 RepID=A0ABU6HE99_9RHOB|nr:TonB family protein [Mesobacterium sp. TK19101]MEC3859974.1 TonB family protein [Mesobacterium sp. TK19101]